MTEISRPDKHKVYKELLGFLELPRLLLKFRTLQKQPRGHGEPLVLVPGFGTTDKALYLLKRYLQYLGFDARGWGLGRNNGNVPKLVPRLVDVLEKISKERQQRVFVIGWSLGGYLAREAAREKPGCVRQIITMGSPVIGGPKYTITGDYYLKKGYDLDKIEADVAARNTVPLTVPIISLYSKNDGIVSWQACIDHRPELVENIEVTTRHLGFGLSPEIYALIAQKLSESSIERREENS